MICLVKSTQSTACLDGRQVHSALSVKTHPCTPPRRGIFKSSNLESTPNSIKFPQLLKISFTPDPKGSLIFSSFTL